MIAPPTSAWAWRAVDASGRRERGVSEAASAMALSRTLEARGLLVLDVEPAQPVQRRTRGARGNARQDVLEVTRALAALLGAGMPLARALETVGDIAGGRAAGALDEVRAGIADGDALATALARHPRLFPPIYVGVVRAGERSGDLAGSFAALATQLEREDRLRARVVAAMVYPIVLAIAGAGAVGVLALYVMPRFAELLEGAGAALPPSTAALLATVAALRTTWPLIVGAAAVVVVGLMAAGRTPAGRRALAATMLQLPLAGRLRRYTLSARFARVLGILLAGGAPLLTALDDAQESLADPIAKEDVGRIRSRVRDGAPLNAAIAANGLWMPLLPRLVAVGEEAGRIEDFLARAAEMCEERADRLLQRLVSLAEPAMILVFGAVVAFVALSLLQAIYGVDAAAFR